MGSVEIWLHSLISQWKSRASREITGRCCSLQIERERAGGMQGLSWDCSVSARFTGLWGGRSYVEVFLRVTEWKCHVMSSPFLADMFLHNLEKTLWGCTCAWSRRDDQAFLHSLLLIFCFLFHMHSYHSCITCKQLKGYPF